MALDRKWICASAVITIATFTAPILAFAGQSAATYKPSSPTPPVRQHFNNAAPPPPPKQKVGSGGSTQSGKTSTTTSAPAQAGARANVQALMEAFRANARDVAHPKPKVQSGSQSGSRNVRLDQENAPAPSNQREKPTVASRKREQQAAKPQ
jgi:hypothetical protein